MCFLVANPEGGYDKNTKRGVLSILKYWPTVFL